MARPMNAKVEQIITAVTAQYQSEPWVVMVMSAVTPLRVLPVERKRSLVLIL